MTLGPFCSPAFTERPDHKATETAHKILKMIFIAVFGAFHYLVGPFFGAMNTRWPGI